MFARGRSSRGAGRRKGRGVKVSVTNPPLASCSNNTSGATDSVVTDSLCANCTQIVGDDNIGCDWCPNWFCPSSMCPSLPDDLINGIKTCGGSTIAYVCTECHATSSSINSSTS